MLSIERKLKIAEIVGKASAIKTSELSNMFNVSEMTILRDFALLEEEGVLKRVHGGAVNIKNSASEISNIIRKQINAGQKEQIAQKAVKHIFPGETIFLDSSTTALALAKKLSFLAEITVIANGLDIINELVKNDQVKIICPGGEFQEVTASFIGPYAESLLVDIFADKSFISASGFSISTGLTVENPVQASIKKIMLKNSKKKFVLVDSSKFDNISLSKVCEINDIDLVVTDKKPSGDYIKYFQKNNVELVY